jgi:hypothetical protein
MDWMLNIVHRSASPLLLSIHSALPKGTYLAGFDTVPRGFEVREKLVLELIQTRTDSPEAGAGADGEGLLLRRFPEPLVALVPDGGDPCQYYFISAAGSVWNARFDLETCECEWCTMTRLLSFSCPFLLHVGLRDLS